MSTPDPFVQFKAMQREGWSLFAPVEVMTTPPAAQLVHHAQLKPGDKVLDVACGTGVVAITTARQGAKVKALDLAPALIEKARSNASIANVSIDFVDGDAEALPYADGEFDAVLSQFGHMFAPRPEVVVNEMLRVLKPGGRIAFSTWPPEQLVGRMFSLQSKYLPPPAGVAPPPLWGEVKVIRERLGERVTGLSFDRGTMLSSTLSPQHSRLFMEATVGPLTKLVANHANDPATLQRFRAEFEELLAEYFRDNTLRMHFLMTRGVKV